MIVASNENLAIEMEHFSGGYNQTLILKEFYFAAKKGENVLILGENGAGKSTFFQALLQLLPVHSGNIRICGRSIVSNRDKQWARSFIGYVPQSHGIGKFPISVEDAVLLGRWGTSFGFGKRPSTKDIELTSELLKRVGIADLRKKDCRLLSGGQRQRLHIARALVRKPKILLLDEPTTYLDENSREMLHVLVDDIRQQEQTTVITITHLKEKAMQKADRILLLKNGSLFEHNIQEDTQ